MAPFWQQTTTTTTQPPAAASEYDYPGRILAWYQRGGAPPPEPPPYSRNWHNSGVFLTALLVVCATLGAGRWACCTRTRTPGGSRGSSRTRASPFKERRGRSRRSSGNCSTARVSCPGATTRFHDLQLPEGDVRLHLFGLTLLGVCFDLLRIASSRRQRPGLRPEAAAVGRTRHAVGVRSSPSATAWHHVARRPAGRDRIDVFDVGRHGGRWSAWPSGAPHQNQQNEEESIEGSWPCSPCVSLPQRHARGRDAGEYVAVFSALVATLVSSTRRAGEHNRHP